MPSTSHPQIASCRDMPLRAYKAGSISHRISNLGLASAVSPILHYTTVSIGSQVKLQDSSFLFFNFSILPIFTRFSICRNEFIKCDIFKYLLHLNNELILVHSALHIIHISVHPFDIANLLRQIRPSNVLNPLGFFMPYSSLALELSCNHSKPLAIAASRSAIV